MKKFFLVKGLDEGEPIQPYVVETEHSRPFWLDEVLGDASRTYEQVTEEEYEQFLAKSTTTSHTPEENKILNDIMKAEAEDLIDLTKQEDYDQYAIDDVIDSMPELVADVLTETKEKEPVPTEIDVSKSRKDLIVRCVKALFGAFSGPRTVTVYERDHKLDSGATIEVTKIYVTRANEYGQWDTAFYYHDGVLLSVSGSDISTHDIDRMRDLFKCSELSNS